MAELLSAAQWQLFRQTINDASDTFNHEVIVWKHLVKKLSRHGDDRPGVETYEDRELNALLQYNAFRVWPIDKLTSTGLLDKDNCLIIINKDYLAGLGYINTNNNFDFNPDQDRFVIHGVQYKPWGDTYASQAYNDPLLQYIILIRDEHQTGRPLV